MKISKARLKEIIKEEVSAFKLGLSERLENESEIKEVERALEQVSSIVKMTIDAAVLDRAEMAEDILVGLLQKMYGAERAEE